MEKYNEAAKRMMQARKKANRSKRVVLNKVRRGAAFNYIDDGKCHLLLPDN
jgi:hypothetical protein